MNKGPPGETLCVHVVQRWQGPAGGAVEHSLPGSEAVGAQGFG